MSYIYLLPEDITGVKEVLDEYGWVKGRMWTEDGYCVFGALGVVSTETDNSRRAIQNEQFAAVMGFSSVAQLMMFNDSPHTIRDDIDERLNRASIAIGAYRQ